MENCYRTLNSYDLNLGLYSYGSSKGLFFWPSLICELVIFLSSAKNDFYSHSFSAVKYLEDVHRHRQSFWSNTEYFYTYTTRAATKTLSSRFRNNLAKNFNKKVFLPFSSFTWILTCFTAEICNETIKYTILILMEIIRFCEVLKA